MLQMISGFWVSRALYVAAELGFADHLHDQPRTAAELAKTTGTHAASVYRVLRALASVGVFVEDEQGRFNESTIEEFRNETCFAPGRGLLPARTLSPRGCRSSGCGGGTEA